MYPESFGGKYCVTSLRDKSFPTLFSRGEFPLPKPRSSSIHKLVWLRAGQCAVTQTRGTHLLPHPFRPGG